MMKKTIFYLLTAISCHILFPAAYAQVSSVDKALRGVDKYIEHAMQEWEVPGLAVAVVKDSAVVWINGFGYRDVEKKLPVTGETQFAIGSCSKAFTAVAVGQLNDEDKVDLDEPVITYIPTFRMYDDYVTNHMTPTDLMCHRSGLPRHDLVWYGRELSRKELFDRLRYLEPSRGFRSAYQYQNLMFMTAGILVEEVSGMKWETFVQNRIFDPLEMNSSNFSVNDMQKTDNFSYPYSKREEKVTRIPFRNIDAIGPAGSINSSVLEMSNWLIMNLNHGKFNGKEIISDSFLKKAHAPQMVSSQTMSDEVFFSSYGLGWGITSYRGYYRCSHGGGIDGFISDVTLYPKDGIGIVVLTNFDGAAIAGVVRNYIADRLLGLEEIDWQEKQFGPVREAREKGEDPEVEDVSRLNNTKPSFPLEEYAGRYVHPAYGTVTISLADSQLMALLQPFEMNLTHYHLDIFEGEDPEIGKQKIKFYYNTQGEIDRLTMQLETGVSDIEFVKEPDVKELDKAALEKYVGEYDFGGAIIKIYITGENTLNAFIEGQPVYELIPVKEHGFALKGLDGFRIIFIVNQKGEAVELISEQPNGSFKAKRK